MVRLILVFVFLILSAGLSSAIIPELKPTLTGECRTIIQNDDQANSMTITFILKPDGTIDNIQQSMTALGNGSFSYSYCNTSIPGGYLANGKSPTYNLSAWSYYFPVSRTGSDLNTSKTILYILIAMLSILLLLLFIWLGVIIPFKNTTNESTGYIISINNLKYVKIIVWFLAYLCFMVIMYFAWIISYAYLDLEFVSSMFKFVFYTLLVIVFPAFILMVVLIIIHAVKDSNIADELMMGRRIR